MDERKRNSEVEIPESLKQAFAAYFLQHSEVLVTKEQLKFCVQTDEALMNLGVKQFLGTKDNSSLQHSESLAITSKMLTSWII